MYFFTDIGHDDSGYISINFERGSFEVYAKVVEKIQLKLMKEQIGDNINSQIKIIKMMACSMIFIIKSYLLQI